MEFKLAVGQLVAAAFDLNAGAPVVPGPDGKVELEIVERPAPLVKNKALQRAVGQRVEDAQLGAARGLASPLRGGISWGTFAYRCSLFLKIDGRIAPVGRIAE